MDNLEKELLNPNSFINFILKDFKIKKDKLVKKYAKSLWSLSFTDFFDSKEMLKKKTQIESKIFSIFFMKNEYKIYLKDEDVVGDFLERVSSGQSGENWYKIKEKYISSLK